MRILGDYWENVAEKFLKKNHLKTVKRNYFCPMGEIDLIMQDNGILMFVEVKYRKNDDWVSAAQSVTKSKQIKIIKAAQLFLLQNKKYKDLICRFDVVAIEGCKHKPEINWIKNAFY